MKKVYLIIFLLIFITNIKAQDTTKVLFIGNSITYYNNMPQTFEAIANDKGDTTSVTVYAPGGTGFINHVDDPSVYNKFRQGNWDFVVLQPGSNESPGYSETKEQTLIRLKILQDSIIKYSPCAKILLYEISYGVWGNTQSDLTTYNNTMDSIRSNCEYWSDSAQIFFAPAGEAMRTAWNNDQTVMLWGGTGNIHPNAKGSYIIACSIYASIFQKSSFGTTITSSLTQNEASSYQHLADTTVLNHLSNWRINTYNQFTDFTFTINQQNVVFNSQSQNIDSLIWDFGDGYSSTTINPNHSYTQNGSYIVTLTTYKSICSETINKTIIINTLGIKNVVDTKKVFIYPNPTSRYVNISYLDKFTTIKITNLTGQLMKSINVNNVDNVKVDLSSLNSGVYLINLYQKDELINRNKIVIR